MFGKSKADSFEFDNSDFTARSSDSSDFDASYASEDAKRVGRQRHKAAFKIDMDRIEIRPQVRKNVDEEKLVELANSIQNDGQQQPIRVYWSDEAADGAGRYIVLVGHRRYLAHQMLEMDSIECIVEERFLTEAEILELQLIENIQRDDLDPIEEAMAYRNILDAREAAGDPLTAKDLAVEIGISDTKITRSLRLLTLPEAVQKDVAEGIVPPSVIREVLKLKGDDERQKMIDAYKDGATYDQIASRVKAKKSGAGQGSSAKKPSAKKRAFTFGGVKIQATGKSRMTSADLAEALRAWLGELEQDGRAKLSDAA